MSEQTETDAAINAINHSIEIIKSVALKTRNIEYDETLNKTKYYGHSNFEEVNVFGKPVALKEDIDNIKTDTITQDIKTVIINEETGEEEEITETKTLTELLDSKANVNHTHSISDITDYIEPDLTPYAKSADIANSITTKTLNATTKVSTNQVTISNNTNGLWTRAIETYAPNLSNGNHVLLNIGKKNSKGLSAHIGYKYSSTESECGVVFGLYSYGDIVTITNNKLTSTVPIEASNITADNETRLATVETSLTNKAEVGHTHTTTDINDLETLIETKINEAKETIINEAFKEIYPIGSIYVSTSLLSEDVKYDYNLSQYYVLWHGCKWKFMDQEFFLRNSTFNVEYGRDETISFIGVGDTGYVSVTDSYTNSYPYLSVCMYQRIA